MKKKWLLIPALALLFGGALALSITSVKVSQVRAEESVEVTSTDKVYQYEEDENHHATLILKEDGTYTLSVVDGAEETGCSGAYEREGNVVTLHYMGDSLQVLVNDELGTMDDYVDPDYEPITKPVSTDEDSNKYKELYEATLQKIKEIRNTQIVTTIIAVFSGGGCGALFAFGPMLVNRGTINKAKRTADISASELKQTASNMKELKAELGINSEKFDKGVEVMEKTSIKMEETSTKLDRIEKNQEAMDKKHDEDIACLLAIISSSKELVANGTAEALNKRFGK